MPNKRWAHLDPADQRLRRLYAPRGFNPVNGTQVVIRKHDGFELFNNRAYHNYETWSDGYEICDGQFVVSFEDLDECLTRLEHLHKHPDDANRHELVNESTFSRFAPVKYEWATTKEPPDA
jgi:hypothetical protein